MGLRESLETSLRSLFDPGEILVGLRLTPSPGYARMLLQVLFWTGLAGALASATILINHPAAAIGAAPIAAAFAGGVALMIPLSFLAAGVLHVLSLLSGGQAGYAKSYELLSVISSLAPVAVACACLPLPAAGLACGAYGTYLCIRGIERMHQAPGAQAWLVVGSFGALVLFAGVILQRRLQGFQTNLEALANIYSSNPGSGSPLPAPGAPSEEGPAQGQPPMDMAAAAAQIRSSLEMLSAPQGAAQNAAPGARPAATQQQLEQFGRMSSSLLDMANKQIAANPRALDSLPAEQKAQVMRFMQMANQMGGQAQQQALQKMMLQMMAGGAAQGGQEAPLSESSRVDPSFQGQEPAPPRRSFSPPPPSP